MKSLAATLVLASLLSVSVNAQTVQAGIFNPSTNIIEVKAKPSALLSNTNWAVTVTVRWLTSYGITIGAVTSSLSVAKQGAVGTSGSYSYQKFGVVSFVGQSWAAGSQNSLFTAPITGGTGTGTFAIVNDAWTATNNGDFYFESNAADVTSYGTEYYAGSVAGVALPVELTSFTASSRGRQVELRWATATETNNSGFEVERLGGKSSEWTKISFVNGNGTSNNPHTYSYTDAVSAAAKYSYRLKQIDRDGAFKYSNTVEAVSQLMAEDYALSRNYPNPFNPSTMFHFAVKQAGQVSVNVFNTLGQEVRSLFNEVAAPDQMYDVTFNADGLASGTYYYVLRAQDRVEVKKMLLMK